MTKKAKITLSAAFFALFFFMLIGALCIDVSNIGPQGTPIGFASINKPVADAVGFNETLYVISDFIGVFSILTVASLALVGLIQLIKRRNLFKVDFTILALGTMYLLIFILYVFFTVVAVNYRPVIMTGETAPEASFPSSHTLMACVSLGGAMMEFKYLIKSKKLVEILRFSLGIIMIAAVVFRFLSGAHWLTDIIAGIFLSAALLFLHSAVLDRIK